MSAKIAVCYVNSQTLRALIPFGSSIRKRGACYPDLRVGWPIRMANFGGRFRLRRRVVARVRVRPAEALLSSGLHLYCTAIRTESSLPRVRSNRIRLADPDEVHFSNETPKRAALDACAVRRGIPREPEPATSSLCRGPLQTKSQLTKTMISAVLASNPPSG